MMTVAAARPYLEAAEAALGGVADEAERGRVRRVRAYHDWALGQAATALDAAQESLILAERHGDPADVSAAYEALAISAHSRGEWKRWLHLEIERLGPRLDDPRLERVFDVHTCLGEYHLYGDTSFEAIEDHARRTLQMAERMGARRAQAVASCLLGESLLGG